MKTLDNKIKYYELLMYYKVASKYKKYDLPNGYHYEFYKPNDELDWVNIHIESGEFTSVSKGLEYFQEFFGHFKDELSKRCVFIVDDITNEKVGTGTISKLMKIEFGYDGAVDWVAIKKSYQGKKLSKPLISKLLEIAEDNNHKDIILHTQTTSWLAAKIYLDYGFQVLNKEERTGWSILKTLTNHPKLKDYKILEDIYDKRNIEIENQLIDLYKTENFNYNVWYKNNLNKVYTYINGVSHEYDYYIENEKIKLKEIR